MSYFETGSVHGLMDFSDIKVQFCSDRGSCHFGYWLLGFTKTKAIHHMYDIMYNHQSMYIYIYTYTAIIYRLACGYQRTWSMTENEGFGTRTASLLIKVKATCWTQNILVTTWWLKGYTLLFFLHPFLTKVSQFDNLLILEGAYNFLYERQSNLAQFFPPQRMSIFTVHVVS